MWAFLFVLYYLIGGNAELATSHMCYTEISTIHLEALA